MPKVLVVEDHTDIRKIIRMVLEQMGLAAISCEWQTGC